jgi:hypothetical protein
MATAAVEKRFFWLNHKSRKVVTKGFTGKKAYSIGYDFNFSRFHPKISTSCLALFFSFFSFDSVRTALWLTVEILDADRGQNAH